MKLNLQIEVKTPFIIKANESLYTQFDLYKNNNLAYLIYTDKIYNKLSEADKQILRSGKYEQFSDTLQSKYNNLFNSKSLPYFKNKINLNLKEDIFSKNNLIEVPILSIKNLDEDSYLVPYIPGSSLKGAFENAILYKYLKEKKNNNCINNIKEGNKILKQFFYYIIFEDFYPEPAGSVFDNFQLGIYRNINANYYNSSKNNLDFVLAVEKGKFSGSVKIRENWKYRNDFKDIFNKIFVPLNLDRATNINNILEYLLDILDEFTKYNIEFIKNTYSKSNFLDYINITSESTYKEFKNDKYYLFLGSGKGLYFNTVSSICTNRRVNTFRLFKFSSSMTDKYIKPGLLKISKLKDD